jgi:hypothetical protein
MRRVPRWLGHPAAAPLLITLLVLALPGLALFDPIFLDSYAIRLKGHVLSLFELFRPEQTGFANPYYRPLFALLHELVDRLTGDSDLGQRLLALGCHALAAAGLLAFARALGLGRRTRTLALILFLIAPGNVCTAAWPLVGYWTLAAALTWFAAARLVDHVRTGSSRALASAAAWAVVSLFCAESSYHLAALLPLLALLPPRVAPGATLPRQDTLARRRALLAWPLFAAIAALHYAFLEVHARGVSANAPLERIARALAAVPRFLEGGAGGNAYDGSRPLAWVVLACAGGAALLRPKLRLLALLAPLAAFPFAIVGHNDRYGYFATGATALLIAGGLPLAVTFATNGRRRRSVARLAAWAPLALAAVVAFQLPARIASVRTAGRATRALLDGLDRQRARLDDLDRVVFVNTPSPLVYAIAHRLAPRTRAEFESIVARVRMRAFMATDRAYFGGGPAELAPLGATEALVCDGGELVARPITQPMGGRTLLPLAFLARGVALVEPVRTAATGRERERGRDELLARFRKLDDPLASVLIETPIAELEGQLPDAPLQLEFEPLATGQVNAARLPFANQLKATTDLPRPGLLVVVTYFAAEDPLHRLTAEIGRFCDSFEADVDGAPVRIVPAFFHAVGVVVPAGHHVVRVRAKAARSTAQPGFEETTDR